MGQPSSPSATTQGFVNLDLMRSVAVFLVAGAHLLLYTGHDNLGGFAGITGVCIFFVHTALVLMWSLERDPHIARFYLRRAFRIYPLWIVVLLLTMATRLPMSPPFAPHFGYHRPSHGEFVYQLLLLFNMRYGDSVVGASWTLPIEVQMYLALPFLFLAARGMRLLWPFLTLDLFLMFYNQQTRGPIDSSLPMCIPYFLPGIMAYILSKRPHLRRLPAWCFPLVLSMLVAINARFGTFRRSWLFCLALGLALPLIRDLRAAPLRVMSHYIARYSYGIYLSHIACIGVSVYVLRAHTLGLRIAAFVAMFLVLPVVFYHAVEEPMIRLGARLAKTLSSGPVPRIDDKELELEMAP